MSNKIHVKTGDEVMIISGKDKGKTGKVLAVSPAEGKVIVDQMGEPQDSQVTDSQPKVNSNNEEHVISPSLLADQELGDTDDILHALDRLSSVLRCQLVGGVLGCWGDKSSLDLQAVLMNSRYIDQACGCGSEWNQVTHIGSPFLERFN